VHGCRDRHLLQGVVLGGAAGKGRWLASATRQTKLVAPETGGLATITVAISRITVGPLGIPWAGTPPLVWAPGGVRGRSLFHSARLQRRCRNPRKPQEGRGLAWRLISLLSSFLGLRLYDRPPRPLATLAKLPQGHSRQRCRA